MQTRITVLTVIGATLVLGLLPGCQQQVNDAGTAPVVEENAHGVFFDSDALQRRYRQMAEASRPSTANMQRVAVMDTTGFGQAMPALTLEIPDGWIAQGGVDWHRDVECVGNTYTMNWSAASPDGLYQLGLLPKMSWQVPNTAGGIVPMNPCAAAPITSAREWLEYLASQARPGARTVAYRDRPDLVAMLRQADSQAGSQLRFEAGELEIAYDLGGHAMHELLVSTVTFSEMQGTVAAWSDTGIALRAPKGLLNPDLLERFRQSARYEQDWGERMGAWSRNHVERISRAQALSIQQWHARRMNEITMAGMTARHRIRMDTIAEVGRINSRIVADTSATNQRIHDATIDSIQEVQPWRDPGTGRQVDLSIHYNNAWQLDDGRQFLTNDNQFDPGRDLGIGGHRLQPVR